MLLAALCAALAVAVLVPPAITVLPGADRTSQWQVVRARLAGWRAARVGDRTRVHCLTLLESFAAELQAGRPAATALERAAATHPELVPHALGALRLGGDVPTALVADSAGNGREALRRLAACWRIGEGTGAGLAAAVGRVASAGRESERVRLELAARTAEPKATMRVLALLPTFGLVLGAGLGADTIGWLLGTQPGRVVLAAGLLLDGFGAWWARRLVAGVERLL